ncbi:hypothetical protein ACUXPL_000896 [Micrococcus sp. 140720015-1]
MVRRPDLRSVGVAAGAIPALVGALCQELVDIVAIVNALRAMKPGPHEAERLGDLAAAPARGQRQAVPAWAPGSAVPGLEAHEGA